MPKGGIGYIRVLVNNEGLSLLHATALLDGCFPPFGHPEQLCCSSDGTMLDISNMKICNKPE